MRVHHLNINCKNLDNARRKLTSLYSFSEWGWMMCNDVLSATKENNPPAKCYVMVKESVRIVLVENTRINVDTIDDIAFQVDSVAQYCSDVIRFGGTVIEGPYLVDCMQRHFVKGGDALLPVCCCGVSPCHNYVEKAVVKSSVGNVRHTILDKRHFQGDFLPGFMATNLDIGHVTSLSHVDHVALAVPCGETAYHVQWYQKCLQMTRFKTNVTENKSGLVIRARNGNGLRMLTLEEHPCSDIALAVDKNEVETELRRSNVKFVFVESLKDEGSDQVQIFLKHHGGPGVQHVAFYSNDITRDAQCWINCGVKFIKPPLAYYEEIKSTLEKLKENCDVTELSDVGILVDAEKHEGEENENDGYLYQIFTEPVFDSRTFFFELIQRNNASGFGAGNVRALWKALDTRFQTLESS